MVRWDFARSGAALSPRPPPLLGHDLADAVHTAIRHTAAEQAIDLAWLAPDDDPAWWRTPLGVAIGLTRDPTVEVEMKEACQMIGVTRKWGYELLAQGKLRRGELGGVTLGSVMDLIAARERK